jgi:polyribonucleotide nucleotidyltransferase
LKARVERKIGANVLSIETGELAKQAHGSCVVQYGETVVLAAATSAPLPPGNYGFFPLTCEYRERVAAAGKFPGGFLKREGRPTTKEVLTSRLIDRPIRPLFPKGYREEVQLMCLVMASDRQNEADVLAMIAAATALQISPIPFFGPLGSVRLGRIDGQWVPFPTHDDLERSELDLIISGNKDSVLMIEGFAQELPENQVLEAISVAQKYVQEVCDLQEELVAQLVITKAPCEAPPPDELLPKLQERYHDAFMAAKRVEGKHARQEACEALKAQAIAEWVIPSPDPAAPPPPATPEAFENAWQALERRVVRDLILSGTRPDGRDARGLRPITCKVDVFPRVHGSALFQRGETQALATVTLGSVRDEQRVDGLVEEYTQKFMLHYYFPPFSVGECRPIRGPGRREIGHGALAERAVNPVLPDHEKFPYTIRVISDILESNGSSSMASVCAATLGLMAAGVPITNPVAGISIGLVQEGDRRVLLTDIIGEEDHYGDMDFKVAGTQNGVTGIQLDLKVDGISEEVIRETLAQAREARIEILRKMLTVIPRPRSDISPWAPRLVRTKIDPEKIGLLIGPGGKMIRSIQEKTGATIDVEDDGTVTITCLSAEGCQEALRQVESLTANVEVGKIYEGRVISVKDFGAFIEILPGKDGLCHISELADGYVANVSDVCKVGDVVKVKVINIDEQDRVKLSRKLALRELGQPPAKRPPGGGGGRERGR